jgi:hypothetical protein
MTDTIPIILAVEDLLGEVFAQELLKSSGRKFAVGNCLGHKGFGYLKKNVGAFNKSAKGIPILVLTDLDRGKCAPLLIADWLQNPKHNNLIFRVAVREIESWLLADRDSIAKFLGVSLSDLPLNPDEILDPKALVIKLAEKSRKRNVRKAIVPARKSTAKIGPDYNGMLSFFVQSDWSLNNAIKYSPSLSRAYETIKAFEPVL